MPGRHVLVDDDQQLCALEIRREAHHTAAPLQRLEFALHPYTTFVVLPLFALSNAGVRFVDGDFAAPSRRRSRSASCSAWWSASRSASLSMSFVAVKLRVADLPEGVGWPQLVGAGMLGGIGFTMSLFVASLAFRGTAEINRGQDGDPGRLGHCRYRGIPSAAVHFAGNGAVELGSSSDRRPDDMMRVAVGRTGSFTSSIGDSRRHS